MTMSEVEPLAAILRVSAIEVLVHAYNWRVPILNRVELRTDLVVTAVSVAIASLANASKNLPVEIAERAAAVYAMLIEGRLITKT